MVPRTLLFSLILSASLLLPFAASASDQTPAEAVSFYGQRSVAAPITESATPPEFYRRVIAPPIVQTNDLEVEASKNEQPTETPRVPLTRNELLLAKKAQHYIKTNLRKNTGLWDSVQGYSHTTMWDVGSGIAATLALEALNLKSDEEVKLELSKTLHTLKTLPLYNGILPNREYNTKTGLPSGRLSNTPTNGNGWSALDIGRLLIWLKILTQQHPEFADPVEDLLNQWQLDRAIHKGTLYGTKLYRGKEYYRQEGRHGYLQYAASGFKMFGYPLPLPDLDTYLTDVEIDNETLKIDARNVPFFTSDPYVLASLEFSSGADWNQIDTLYALHKNKSAKQGKLYSYAEDAMSKNPWFAYNNLYYYGKPWTSVSPAGKVIENPQILSHKVAFGFSVLYDDEYGEKLFQAVLNNSLHARSIPTGEYENGGLNTAFNINTNSLILVALWYKQNGRQPIYVAPLAQ
ncbi:DUF3131 domain-containing protein [Vibrio panuliri]|uniref:DUF3131 domain-containing protein n=1 Tax=Vibrio panuliri TaxID=1381081 RepID=A0ABX3FRM5_9VIBR|nr:DUF3131 domain-containing protein [Vibrio panuliri]OLQ96435.1 hypothetical protein BIY20_19005 [Vibrio panuliri]